MEIDTSPRVMTRGRCKELTSGGGPYFNVTYKKEGVNLPDVETLVYLGSAQMVIDGELQTRFMFQHAWSYQEDGSWIELPKERRRELMEDASVLLFPEVLLPLIADIDGLVVLLNQLREKMRRGWGWERVLPPEG
jgi:hypothetical protein